VHLVSTPFATVGDFLGIQPVNGQETFVNVLPGALPLVCSSKKYFQLTFGFKARIVASHEPPLFLLPGRFPPYYFWRPHSGVFLLSVEVDSTIFPFSVVPSPTFSLNVHF